jgi:Replication-relaxation
VSADELPRFQLTPRDREILQSVCDYRAMSTPQIDALLFAPAGERADTSRVSSRCLHRLRMLSLHGLLRRVEQEQTLSEGRKPLVYFLDRGGAEYLAARNGCTVDELGWDRQGYDVRSLFLDHLLVSNDFRVAMTLAARANKYSLAEWRDERAMRQEHQHEPVEIVRKDKKGVKKRYEVALIPDGYFVLDTPTYIYHHFLEIDLGTSTLQASDPGRRSWARKVAAYLEYYNSEAYQERYHTDSLRILTITTSETRLEHLKQVTEHAGGKGRFWFTTIDKITATTILTEPIWHKAGSTGLFSLVW